MKGAGGFHSIVDKVVQLQNVGYEKKYGYLHTEDEHFDGKNITVSEGHTKTNLASCSYLGLEFHPTVKDSAKDAIERFGTQFSCSRSFLSCGLYTEAEDLLSTIFGNENLILAPSTSVGHLVVMPVIIGSRDLVITDHQAHFSMQFVFKMLQSHGTDIQMCKHNDLNHLESLIIENRDNYDRIWYVFDGIYSMFGDVAPLQEIEGLLNRYDNLYAYGDDAHGMSWTGENGKGYLLSQIDQHEKMIIATSLNKSFAAGGGVILLPNAEWKHKARMYGGHMMFSGPLQNGSLGAIIGSAKVHLSQEIKQLQGDFHDKLTYCQYLLKEHKLPVVAEDLSPIFFIGVGLPVAGFELVDRMIHQEGYMVCVSAFPAVPHNCTGIRFTLNNNLDFPDIERFVKVLAHHFPLALEHTGRTIEDVYHGFRKINSFDWMNKAGTEILS